MSDDILLSSQDREHLLFTIEASLKIGRRFQFFLWAQGVLQGVIPHQTLLCAHGDLEKRQLSHLSFSADAQPDRQTGQALDPPLHDLLPRLVTLWLREGGTPCLLGADALPEADVQSGRWQLLRALREADLDHVAAHGLRQMQGGQGSFFVFIGTVPYGPRDRHLLELLVPHLHAALQRLLANEPDEADAAPDAIERLLTPRERQVLHWVRNGKSNKEIARLLGISPLTVKNHVQRILVKLKVNNRTQAANEGSAAKPPADETAD